MKSGVRNAVPHQLQCLIGLVNHVAAVVKPGGMYIHSHHLIETMKISRKPSHCICLNVQCKADITWWILFLEKWNSISFFPPICQKTTHIRLIGLQSKKCWNSFSYIVSQVGSLSILPAKSYSQCGRCRPV